MNNAISNNPNYDMPDDSFFNFYFLIHKNRIFTTKIALKVGEITTALLNKIGRASCRERVSSPV